MLGLLAATDARWADEALADLDAVLRDHAHCEMKAAAHALSLAARHPDDLALSRKLSALAREELDHFERVLDFLDARKLTLGTPLVDTYAAALRERSVKLPRLCAGAPVPLLVDRLLVCALIEARSCERFKLLVDRMGEGHELHAFYKELFVAEARHFREYVELATNASSAELVEARLAQLAAAEAEIIRAHAASPTARATIHG